MTNNQAAMHVKYNLYPERPVAPTGKHLSVSESVIRVPSL